MIQRIVKLSLRQDGIESFLQHYERTAPRVRGFEGCRSVELLRAKHRDSVFFSVSEWESEMALEAYRRSELFEASWSFMAPLFHEPAQAWTVARVEPG